MDIGKTIEKGLKKKRISQKEFASMIGVTPPNVSQWVKGTASPSGEKLLRIISALDIVTDLFPEYKKKDAGKSADFQNEVSKIWNKLENLDQKLKTTQKGSGQKKKVLVIEDDALIPVVIKNLLIAEEYEDFEVISTYDPLEALNIMEANSPALITLDLLMPQISGIEFLKMIKSNNRIKNIPVILITGADEKILKEARYYHPEAIMKKPFEYIKFVKILKDLSIYPKEKSV